MSVCDNPKDIVNQGKFPPQKRHPSSDLVFWDRPSGGLLWSRSIPNSTSKANHHKFNTTFKKKKRNPLFKTSPDADLSKSVPEAALKGSKVDSSDSIIMFPHFKACLISNRKAR